MRYAKRVFLFGLAVILILVIVLALLTKNYELHVLYAVSSSNDAGYDQSAYDNFKQTLEVNVVVDREALDHISPRRLHQYDVVYLDIGLKKTAELQGSMPKLIDFVRQGGLLFLENGFASEFPLDFLGASRLVDVPDTSTPQFVYPDADNNLTGIQTTFHLFADNFLHHGGMSELPGFHFGIGTIPSSAETIVSLNGTALMSRNRFGKGAVLLLSDFLPNRYFITGFDLKSGQDPSMGFSDLTKQLKNTEQTDNPYFDFKTGLQHEPYFSFTFAAANYELRNEILAYASKERFGFSVKKVLGPYGRPAMAFQNHYEAQQAFQRQSAQHWTEVTRAYDEIPSFSLVRAAFTWGKWYESAVVHLNTGTQAKPVFIGQLANSFYTSGVQLVSGKKPIEGADYPDYRSYGDPIELPYRFYPSIADVYGDDQADLLGGSADGSISLYRNLGKKKQDYADQPLPEQLTIPDAFDSPQRLKTTDGTDLKIPGGYAAITVFHENADVLPDLIIGDGDGNVFYSLNQGNGVFTQPLPVTVNQKPLNVGSFAAPAYGDVDGDGVPDLVIGTGDGRVLLYQGINGSPLKFAEPNLLITMESKFAAPSLYDINGDGSADLVIGSSQGDIEVFLHQGDHWVNQGPITGQTQNQVGTNALVGGHNSVPLWYDLNHDGKDDLVVGQLEFGMPYAVDDPASPIAGEVKSFVQFAKDHFLELYPHVFVHSYLSSTQEQEELRLQRESFDKLGITWKNLGTNQHTWRIDNQDRTQTLRNENAQGLWFNFGFRPSYDPLDPRDGVSDYMWGLPFLLEDAGTASPMLLYTPIPGIGSGPGYANEDIFQAFVRQDMPIDYFEHIDYMSTDDMKRIAAYWDHIRTANDYNFLSEPQMAASFLTALTAKVHVNESWLTYCWDRLKDKLGKGVHLTLSFHPDYTGVPSQAGEYSKSLGIVVETGKRYAAYPLATNADVFLKHDNRVYLGLPHTANLQISWMKEAFHLIRSNVPFSLSRPTADGHRTLQLNANGMQQVKLYSPVPIVVKGTDLQVDSNEQERTYTITHFGTKTTVEIAQIG